MSVLFFMIGVSLTMGLLFLGTFVWAMRTGQNDDLHTPGMRVLFEEDDALNLSTPTPSPKPKLL